MKLYISPSVGFYSNIELITGVSWDEPTVDDPINHCAVVNFDTEEELEQFIVKYTDGLPKDWALFQSDTYYYLAGKNGDSFTNQLKLSEVILFTENIKEPLVAGRSNKDSIVVNYGAADNTIGTFDGLKGYVETRTMDSLEAKIKDLEAQLLAKDSKLVELTGIAEKAIVDRDKALENLLNAQNAIEKVEDEANYYKEENERLWQRIVSNDGYAPIGIQCPAEEKKEDSKIKYITIKGVKYRV